MSCDSTETEYHLTPKGWIVGTSKVYNDGAEKELPKNRVETWIRKMTQSSSFSREDVSWKCIWTSKDHSHAELEALHKKYPRPDY